MRFYTRQQVTVEVGYVSEATRQHERAEAADIHQRKRPGSWVRVARNRIAFRHDDSRGPISATLPHAVY